MSITANLERISTAKENIKNKLIEKGVDVPANARLDEFPDMFDQIQTGGGSDEWASIGYTATPPYISDDIAYSKEIYDNWDANSTTKPNLQSNYNLVYAPNFDFSNVTNLGNLHYMNTSLLYSPLVIKNNITNIRGLFYNCKSLKQIDVSNWDISNVTDLANVFYGCEKLTELDVSNWDTSNVTDLGALFEKCMQVKTLDVSKWDTSNVTYMKNTFCGCSGLKSLDVSKWDTSNVTSMYYLFGGCSGLESLDISNWDTSNVKDIGFMFSSLNFTTLDISKNNFDNAAGHTNIFNNAKIKEVIGYLDLDKCYSSVLNYSYIIGYSSNSYLRKITFKNFGRYTSNINGINTDSYSTFKNMTNWGVDDNDVTGAKQSVIDTLITYSVDRISEGYGQNATVTLSANTKALLTEDEIAQITAKGYTIA